MKRSLGAKTMLYPTPVLLVGTYDNQGRANVMTAAWGGICCSKPPCVTVSLRKATYSYDNIVARGAYTVGIPTEAQVVEADYFGIASGRDVDKVARTGMTAVPSDVVDAPYLAEVPLVLECKLAHTFELGLHTMFVGQVLDVKVEESMLDSRGRPDVEKLRPMVFSPEVRVYHGLGAVLGAAFDVGRRYNT